MIFVLRRYSDSEVVVVDSEDGVKETVSLAEIEKAKALGIKMKSFIKGEYDYNNGYFAVVRLKDREYQLYLYHKDKLILDKVLPLRFKRKEPSIGFCTFYVSVYEIWGNLNVSCSLYDKHYFAEDREGEFLYSIQVDTSNDKVISESKYWEFN